MPYVFAHAGLFTDAPAVPTAPSARAGHFAYDTMTLIGPGTWEAARAAVDAALTAADLVLDGAPGGYACCRPPGHHVTRTSFGGSCYLNNAAAAAARLRDALDGPVAVIDIDAHHGNGTQAIFYEDPDVLVGSVHVDPGRRLVPALPRLRGRDGRRGANRNVPLAPGAGDEAWLAAVRDLAAWARGAAQALVVALGVDAAGGDPESPLEVTAAGFRAAGRALGALGLPTVVVQEGGYDLDDDRSAGAASSWPAWRRGCMAESMWVGKDEHEGVRAQPRKDLQPPPHWRLEAIAQTPRPHSLSVAPASCAVFVEAAAESSDVWLLDLEAGGAPERLTTGRAPVPVLGRHRAAPVARRLDRRLRRRRPRVARADRRRPAAPARRGRRPVWIDGGRLVDVAVERDDTTRLAVVDVADPWPRRLAVEHGDARRARRRGRGGRLARRHARSPTPSRRAPTCNRSSEIRVADLDDGRGARGDRRAATCTTTARRGRPTAPRSPTRRSAAASTSCTRRPRRRRVTASSPARAPTTSSPRGTRTARAWSRCAGGATASTS